MSSKGWIGVDLDGTLAVYEGWKGIHHIGEPVELVLQVVKDLLAADVEVRIFTARMQEPNAKLWINDWCKKHLGRVLPVTDRKDFSMVGMIDDRAVTVEKNTGRFLSPLPDLVTLVQGHWQGADAPSESFNH